MQLSTQKQQHRFIPAGAGNTSGCCSAPRSVPVHPRWRGEHTEAAGSNARRSGSSPLARGTHRPEGGRGQEIRFIPAGAGNTYSASFAPCQQAVHPRWRGEHPVRCCQAISQDGSSPLARGTPRLINSDPMTLRFIPAGAGNTSHQTAVWQIWPVHPRWRGEHVPERFLNEYQFGSSPLARGTRDLLDEIIAGSRFIPAGAGNTALMVTGIIGLPVHPRWRGEHLSSSPSRNASFGSSPLARGTPRQILSNSGTQRFIPAGAGNTIGKQIVSINLPVHPRWRGEHTSSI